jgi:hypothetical protein
MRRGVRGDSKTPFTDASLAPCKNFFSNNLGSKNIHINTTVSHHHNSTPNLVATNNISLEHPTTTHHQHSNQQKIQPDNSAHTYIVNILHTNETSNKQLKRLQQTQSSNNNDLHHSKLRNNPRYHHTL